MLGIIHLIGIRTDIARSFAWVAMNAWWYGCIAMDVSGMPFGLLVQG
jgi:hypothetical protein